MAVRLSRTRIARYVADRLQAGDKNVIRRLAAYLIDESRTGEADLIIRSIYDELEQSGVIVADVTTAKDLDGEIKDQIKQLLSAEQLDIREHIDPSVLGGIRIATASRVLDATLKNRLKQLHERKV